ncbi:MAG: acetyl-CoA carboxylase biotin carboxylase subunit [Burkholderiaceae bacterium]|nr:acetyl-CoA carboxylase biotin carboxylase subunit [Burkholderiaceae bacterium]
MMRRVLIANRGEIAIRIIRACREMGIQTVAVYSDADMDAPHVLAAHDAVRIGEAPAASSYLNVAALLDAAARTGADAIHPGYGFLSENAGFARACEARGLIWIGPASGVIERMGSKTAAREAVAQAGVPVVPGDTPEDQHTASVLASLARVGYPALLKATAGGGGKGMRIVRTEAEAAESIDAARREAERAFSDGTVYVERLIERPRHIEVQIMADQHGSTVHLFERDCTLQRRHQKVIEEAPGPTVTAAIRERMTQAAVAAARAVGYVNAGTIEFLLSGDEFYFLEMNTRLQVEHPVTEAVTGLDLVEWQLRMAQGEGLPRTQDQVTFTGHSIEVRLCAEDAHYTPHSGTITYFTEPPSPTRFDHAIYSGMSVAPYYDSMLGKLIAHAPTRQQAIEQLSTALSQTQLLGLPSNRSFLKAILQDAEFQAGQARIPFLVHKAEALRHKLQVDEQRCLLYAAIGIYFAVQGQGQGENQPAAQLACPFAKSLRLQHRDVMHLLSLQELGGGKLKLHYNGIAHVASYPSGMHGQDFVTVDDLQERVCAVQLAGQRWHVQVGGVDLWLEDSTLTAPVTSTGAAGSAHVRAKFNGKVIAIQAEVGAAVKRGDTLLVIESMKLEHAIAAPQDGVIEGIDISLGQQAATGQLLVRLAA